MAQPTILLLSTSDTDLISARSSGKNYRWANPSRLSEDELPALLADASVAVVRILGGYRAWQGGIDLLPNITGRVVTVSSSAHRSGAIDFADQRVALPLLVPLVSPAAKPPPPNDLRT